VIELDLNRYLMPNNVNNFTGIEAFCALEILKASGHNMSMLPSLSFAPNLRRLDVGGCANLTGGNIDLTQNPLLEIFKGMGSGLQVLPDFSGNPLLKHLNVQASQLTTADLSGMSNLRLAWLYNNQITSFDFTGCTMLNELFVSNNNAMTTIDVSMCASLVDFYVVNCGNVTDIYLGSTIPITQLTGFSTSSSNAAVLIHVGTAARVAQAQSYWGSGIVGTFVI